ncbi:Sugar kinase of the NBD/HSP70 family, may contain an N-terminal HTH domain [Plantibacter sp. VKM Ac-1784]|uniref:Sugar kinase of the NBD/HSP70 family, may contain an N-terminal HTH domain n=1 Tax=Plantibacter elymi (nom. nud.) TaxID=199708 RepID=A0ABY1RHQ4_9MICO|nr:ROK family protein [Plantibacter sp. VKM Ac-1784]SMQ73612.1 Sugar kinase of the NBD/HSP70 family, may contain an N-terminal HTH domain [Plantibacter sp. VKM Ac-1784]
MSESTAVGAGPAGGSGMGSGLDSVRRRNLGRIVELVHQGGVQSRSALTKATGLNRSTVAALVTELASIGIVTESVPVGGQGVGRPSPLVSAGPRAVAFAANPELDAITVAAVRIGGEVVERVRREVDTTPTAAEATAIIAELVAELADRLPDEARGGGGIGLAIPGLVRDADGVVRLAPHLGWVDEPLVERLRGATGRAVFAANDASLGARAERTFGAGRGIDDLVYLNGGASGIGGGIIAGGRPVGGARGYAGEFGHTSATAAGNALEDAVRRSELLRVAGLAAGDDAVLEAALAEGIAADPAGVMREEVVRQARTLGRALAGTVNILDPELVVLGGHLGIVLELASEELHDAVRERALVPPFEDVTIVRAELGQDLLLIGAAELAFDRLIADPAAW